MQLRPTRYGLADGNQLRVVRVLSEDGEAVLRPVRGDDAREHERDGGGLRVRRVPLGLRLCRGVPEEVIVGDQRRVHVACRRSLGRWRSIGTGEGLASCEVRHDQCRLDAQCQCQHPGGNAGAMGKRQLAPTVGRWQFLYPGHCVHRLAIMLGIVDLAFGLRTERALLSLRQQASFTQCRPHGNRRAGAIIRV